MGNVVFGDDFGVDMIFNSKVLGRKAKGVPSHGIKNIVSVFTALSRHYVKGGIRTGMTHVKTLPRRIGKFHKRKELRLIRAVLRMKNSCFFPFFLPLFFNRFIIVRYQKTRLFIKIS